MRNGLISKKFVTRTAARASAVPVPQTVPVPPPVPTVWLRLPEPFTGWSSLLRIARKAAQLQPPNMYYGCSTLPSLLPAMCELDALEGLDNVKAFASDRIQYFTQDDIMGDKELHNLVLTGPPGCGKSTVAHILARIFNRLNALETDKLVIGNRRNMIGSHLGETAKMTAAVIKQAKGGTLLIDEAYQLGGGGGGDEGDSYSYTCLHTLNELLTSEAGSFLCIMSGYRQEIERQVFDKNPGLRSRFPDRLDIPSYSTAQLSRIFTHKATKSGLKLPAEPLATVAWFNERRDKFKYFGRSVESLVVKLRMVYSRRCFGLPRSEKGVVTREDLDGAFSLYDAGQPEEAPMSMELKLMYGRV
jgi:energy-coupling factor transporter ATP-binding protein EcfA2